MSLRVGTVEQLHAAAARLTGAGVPHGDVTDLPPFGLVILSLQDPDGINLELAAVRPAGLARRSSIGTDPVSGFPVIDLGREVTSAEVAEALDDE